MSTDLQVTDDCPIDIMDTALATLRAKKLPLVRVGDNRWMLDRNMVPAIIVGYGTDDPERMSSMHHIIKYKFTSVPCYGVVDPKIDYAVKHTRVAHLNVKVFDPAIPADNVKDYLRDHYVTNLQTVVAAFQKRGHDVAFEDVAFGRKKVGESKKGRQPKHVNTTKKASKTSKAGEDDTSTERKKPFWLDEDGEMVRCTTPQRRQKQQPIAQRRMTYENQSEELNKNGEDTEEAGGDDDITCLGALEDGVHIMPSVEKSIFGPQRTDARMFNTREHRVEPY